MPAVRSAIPRSSAARTALYVVARAAEGLPLKNVRVISAKKPVLREYGKKSQTIGDPALIAPSPIACGSAACAPEDVIVPEAKKQFLKNRSSTESRSISDVSGLPPSCSMPRRTDAFDNRSLT